MKKLLPITTLWIASTTMAFSQPQPLEFAPIANGVTGAIYHPETTSPHKNIAVLVMHAEGDYSQFSAGKELAQRGFTVLNANNSAAKRTGNDLEFERSMTEIGQAVQYLREREGVEKVVLLGHSGGGAMFSAYQNIAENGLSACNGSEKIVPCSDKLANLPAADGLVLLDANYGLSTMTLLSLDPSIINENSSLERDNALDLFNPEHGFTAQGANYTDAFRQAYFKAVSERMNRLISTNQARSKLIAEGKGNFLGDEPLTIPAANYLGGNNKLFSQDPSLLAHTEKEWLLLKADGTQAVQIVPTTRLARNLKRLDEQYQMALRTTVNRFLNTFAIRTNPETFAITATGFTGVDWDSTQTSPISAVKGIKKPLLAVGLTGNWEYLGAEKIIENAISQDKTAVFVEGASHVVTPIDEKYGDTVKRTYDYIADWLKKADRF